MGHRSTAKTRLQDVGDKCGGDAAFRRNSLTTCCVLTVGSGQRDLAAYRRRKPTPDSGRGARVLETSSRTGYTIVCQFPVPSACLTRNKVKKNKWFLQRLLFILFQMCGLDVRASVIKNNAARNIFFISHLFSFISARFRVPSRVSMCLQCFDTVGWAAGRASGL